MIVPEGAVLILREEDEYQHTPETASNYNESMYFNAFDTAQGCGLWMRIGNRANEGHAEVTCCMYLPDGRVGFMFARPEITGNELLAAAGMSIEVVRPFERFRVRYKGDLLLMDDPYAMSDPGKAFKTYPRVPASIDLEIDGISPMHGGEIVKPDGSPWHLDPETAVFRGHTEQHTRSSGQVSVGDWSVDLDGLGVRDKSWGPRHWQSFYWYRWVPLTFSRDFGVLLALMGRPDGPPVVTGHVFADGRLDPLIDAEIDVRWAKDSYPRTFTLNLKTSDGSYFVEAENLAIVPLRHRRTLPGGELTVSRITEAMTRYRCNGKVALGVSEFLDLMVNDVPISISRTHRS